METATRNDVVRLFPGIQDHAVLEILAAKATIDELEGALLLLQGDDDALMDFKQQSGSRLNQLIQILENSEIRPQDDLD